MLALLRRLEWSAPCPSRGDGWYECPECKASAHTSHMEHHPTCALAIAIRSLEPAPCPTDPAELAAWLYARVVPGQTVVEWEAPSVDRVRRCKSFVVTVEIDGDHIVVWPNDPALYIPPPPKHVTRAIRLLNPDGTVLWEAK